jgi:hypothetical protein
VYSPDGSSVRPPTEVRLGACAAEVLKEGPPRGVGRVLRCGASLVGFTN